MAKNATEAVKAIKAIKAKIDQRGRNSFESFGDFLIFREALNISSFAKILFTVPAPEYCYDVT